MLTARTATLRRRTTDKHHEVAQGVVTLTVRYRGEELSMITSRPEIDKVLLFRKARQYDHRCEGP